MKRRRESNLGRCAPLSSLRDTGPGAGDEPVAREALERSRAALAIGADVTRVEAAAEGR